MCGRYTIIPTSQQLEARFGFEIFEMEIMPRYNVAPSQDAPVLVAEAGVRQLKLMRWGLVPSWAKDPSFGAKTINARAETIREKPTYRKAFAERRCLVLADSFYEWRKEPNSRHKTPVRIMLANREPFAFAGLWERWRQPEGSDLLTFTIITTTANEFIQPIHERMPVILTPETEAVWLDSQAKPADLFDALQPYPADRMHYYEVGSIVNSPKNDTPVCIEPATLF